MFANEALVDKLFSILEREEPLNPLLAGYFAKIVSTLIARRPEETFQVKTSGCFPANAVRMFAGDAAVSSDTDDSKRRHCRRRQSSISSPCLFFPQVFQSRS
jgi:hypothetical protein